VLVGTASWADKPLLQSGRFYPNDVKTPEARLRYYASQFPLVEVDSTYYALPSEENSRKWVERTPEDASREAQPLPERRPQGGPSSAAPHAPFRVIA
jgi:hypothetical protein